MRTLSRKAIVVGALAAFAIEAAGAVPAPVPVDLAQDPRFDPAIAIEGGWHPEDFRDGGIYVTAPVDAAKEVVLFVHGVNGTPRDFLDVAAHLDPARQQAWFAYYATGNSIVASSEALAGEILEMSRATGIHRVRVFAHSVGGLVAWHLAVLLEGRMEVTQFVSVNTPWDGSSAARWGAWLAPRPRPIWIDLVPASTALTAIREEAISAPFTLVYTIRDPRREADGDGTIGRDSALCGAMERRASRVVRESGTHTSVLHGPKAATLARLLGRRDETDAVMASE